MDDELVMYCIFSMEAVKLMGGNRGKMASMAGHAYLHSYWDAEQKNLNDLCIYDDFDPEDYRWKGLAKKVTLRVDTTAELLILEKKYESICGISLVKDSALTVFEYPTVVCLGIGPIRKSDVEDDIKNLKVLI